MKRGEQDTVTVRDLSIMIGDDIELRERVAEYLGDDWTADPQRRVTYQLPAHCTRLDNETSYEWSD